MEKPRIRFRPGSSIFFAKRQDDWVRIFFVAGQGYVPSFWSPDEAWPEVVRWTNDAPGPAYHGKQPGSAHINSIMGEGK